MLKPEPMTRCVIVAPKDQQRPIIEALHGAGIAHINDYHPSGANGLKIGRPLPEGSAASERLVRLRAVSRVLGVVDANGNLTATAPANLDGTLAEIETEVDRLATTRDEAREAASLLRERRARLEPLQGLPLRLEDYKGYSSLSALVGRVKAAPNLRSAVGDEHALFTSQDGATIAAFVPAAKRDKALEALASSGFTELEVPEGTGDVNQEISRIDSELTGHERRATDAEASLKRLGETHAAFLTQAETYLATEVEKAEAPLHFAHTDYTFMADVWVPTAEKQTLVQVLDRAVGNSYHLEVLSDGHGHHDHGHGHAEAAATTPGLTQAGDHLEHQKEDKGATPPTKFKNRGYVKPFEAFVDMFSRPKYDEIDPTAIVAIAFPIFFGIMIGDWGFGLIMILLGALLLTKMRHLGDTVKSLGIAILAAGIVAAGTGWFVFGDGFGIPNSVTPTLMADVAADLPAGATVTCGDVLHHEPTWNCLFADGSYAPEAHPHLIGKITDVPDFIAVSLIAAFFHLFLGYLFGAMNEAHHSKRHMMAKIGWMFVLVGLFGIIFSQLQNLEGSRTAPWLWKTIYEPLPIDGLALSGILAGLGVLMLMAFEEGVLRFLAPIESLGLLSNIMSYSRLAGVAVAKGAMIFAFNSIFLTGMIIGSHGNPVLIFFGALGLVICQLLVLGLGILSSGIQGIRLQYVEFFLKFYKGGGVPYAPFGRKTAQTTTA
ncbi:MAG TPA: V-type ATP synthase subunit I [Candidatus Thermoplasmatota archaeon]|nr:V-type ATP synthase subunit I [Candidatus Thermoplasmatota archaeon]